MDTAMDADAAVGEETPAQMDDAHVASPAAEATMDAENPTMATTAASRRWRRCAKISRPSSPPGPTGAVQSGRGISITRVNVRDVSGEGLRESAAGVACGALAEGSCALARRRAGWEFHVAMYQGIRASASLACRSPRRSFRLCSRRPSILVPPCASSIVSNDRVTIGFERRPRTVRVVSSRTR